MRQALAALETAGAVRRVPGRGGGTFVSGRKVERDLSRVVGVPALLRSQGMTSGSRVVGTGIVAADDATRAALDLPTDAYVIDVVRIRLADGIPISLEHARFPAERFPRLLEMPLGGSLYDLLEEHYDTLPGEAEEHIEVAAASADEAAILATEIGAPLLVDHPRDPRPRRRPLRVLARPVPRRPHDDHRPYAGPRRGRGCSRPARRAAAPRRPLRRDEPCPERRVRATLGTGGT